MMTPKLNLISAYIKTGDSGSEDRSGKIGGVNLLHAFICDHPGKRTSEISKVLNVPQKTIERSIHKLKAEQKITFVGSPKTGGYKKKEAIG